ncbi:unnamed protein product [Paramecium sonneborni]|uniref:Uncharacterized protein n=1 Tax=Paramecium sonneborni TaxID=65129 RepID=A0A8S1RND6_9CILI|nr:unnamed protein product [Paramecium sonneborni]
MKFQHLLSNIQTLTLKEIKEMTLNNLKQLHYRNQYYNKFQSQDLFILINKNLYLSKKPKTKCAQNFCQYHFKSLKDRKDEIQQYKFYSHENSQNIVEKSIYQSFQEENNEVFASFNNLFKTHKLIACFLDKMVKIYFIESSKDQEQRIKAQSILESWRSTILNRNNLQSSSYQLQIKYLLLKIYMAQSRLFQMCHKWAQENQYFLLTQHVNFAKSKVVSVRLYMLRYQREHEFSSSIQNMNQDLIIFRDLLDQKV